MKVEVVKDALCSNHETLARWNHAKKKKYMNAREDMLLEKTVWEKEKALLDKASKPESEVVKLNVGGTHHLQTTTDILMKDPKSALAKLFSGKHKKKEVDGEVFLDRDGATF